MSELFKSCPFCGRSDTLGIMDVREGIVYLLDRKLEMRESVETTEPYAVTCTHAKKVLGCGARGGCRKTPKEAIKAWNERDRAE